MEKQQTPLEKYLDEKYPIMTKTEYNNKYPNRNQYYADYLENIKSYYKIATEAYEFALQQPLPPTPELQQMLDEKYPIKTNTPLNLRGIYSNYNEYEAAMTAKRKEMTEFYLAGQSSLKQGTPTDEIKEIDMDMFLETWGYQTGTGYGSALFDCKERLKKDLDIILNMHRATYASKQDIDWDEIKADFFDEFDNLDKPGAAIMCTTKNLNDLVDWFKSRPEFA